MKLKSRMTVGEMSEHLTEHTGKFANRVSVGRYAKKLGYAVYKPMINGRICQFYVNPSGISPEAPILLFIMLIAVLIASCPLRLSPNRM